MAPTELQVDVQAEKRLAGTLDEYAGQWVAVRDHAVAGHADSLRGLLDRIDPKSVDRIFEVPERGAECFFYPLDLSVRRTRR
jgi:hypothetical protein